MFCIEKVYIKKRFHVFLNWICPFHFGKMIKEISVSYTHLDVYKRQVIGFASEGSEHGQDNIEEAMKIAEMKGLKAVPVSYTHLDVYKRQQERLPESC